MDGIIITANENFLKPMGYTLDEVQGRHHNMFVEPDVRTSTEYKEFWAKPLHFHAAGGAGYAFLADRVLELDGVNPLIGARILSPLGRWQRLDAARQELMKGQLERILAKPGLSRDIFEIASKSLGKQ